MRPWLGEMNELPDRTEGARAPLMLGLKKNYIHQNCLKRLRPWASCPFFLLFCFAHTLFFPLRLRLDLFLTLSSFSFSPPNFASASPFLPLHLPLLLFLSAKCVWLPSWQAVCEISVSMCMRTSERPVCVSVCVI